MEQQKTISRRTFLAGAAAATVFATVGGKEILGKIIPKLNSAAATGRLAGTFSVSLDQFAALQQVDGSVRLSIAGLNHKVLVTRVAETEFTAVSEVCTHSGCAIGNYEVANKRFQCPCHGSRFAADGSVLRGPAPRALDSYPVEFDSAANMVHLEIAGISAAPDQPDAAAYLAPIAVSNGMANVRYGLAAPARVTLTIWTVAGEQVMIPVEQAQEAGEHTAVIAIGQLPAGQYLCRIQTSDGFSATEKFVVVR
ncbi:MAG: Rieske 2Fe-2S domain-containing protein [Armatimonadetes bacterium]|nr:Rieske 2Fe-2S domain-containing protein [Armatimonadota bacterium]